MIVVVVLFWISLAALAWTHVVYPLVAIGLARIVPRPVHDADVEPTVAVIVAAYNEESVIARRLENLLELDYPADRLQIVVTSDASDDRTEAIALQFPGVKVITNPRGGKVAAQDRAVRQTDSEWSPSPTRTRRGRPTRCASSSGPSPTPRSPTSAGSCTSSASTARTRRASTGATSSAFATPSHGSDR